MVKLIPHLLLFMQGKVQVWSQVKARSVEIEVLVSRSVSCVQHVKLSDVSLGACLWYSLVADEDV